MEKKYKGGIMVYVSLLIMSSAAIGSYMGFIVMGLFFMLVIGMHMVIHDMYIRGMK